MVSSPTFRSIPDLSDVFREIVVYLRRSVPFRSIPGFSDSRSLPSGWQMAVSIMRNGMQNGTETEH